MSEDDKKAVSPRGKASRVSPLGQAHGKELMPGAAAPTPTDKINEALEPRMERLARKMLDAMEAGLDSNNVQVRVNTMHKVMGHLYKPTQTVKVEGDGNTVGNTVNFNIISTDGLSAEDRAMLERVKAATSDAVESAEVVEVIELEDLEGQDG